MIRSKYISYQRRLHFSASKTANTTEDTPTSGRNAGMSFGTNPGLPDEMLSFNVLNSAPSVLAPRLGRLSLEGRKALQTPCYVPLTSRGTLPHITHDMMRDHTSIGSLYVGLEDC